MQGLLAILLPHLSILNYRLPIQLLSTITLSQTLLLPDYGSNLIPPLLLPLHLQQPRTKPLPTYPVASFCASAIGARCFELSTQYLGSARVLLPLIHIVSSLDGSYFVLASLLDVSYSLCSAAPRVLPCNLQFFWSFTVCSLPICLRHLTMAMTPATVYMSSDQPNFDLSNGPPPLNYHASFSPLHVCLKQFAPVSLPLATRFRPSSPHLGGHVVSQLPFLYACYQCSVSESFQNIKVNFHTVPFAFDHNDFVGNGNSPGASSSCCACAEAFISALI